MNSAISLALQGLGQGVQGISFKTDISKMDIKDLFKIKDLKIKKKEKSTFFKFDSKISSLEKWLIRSSISIVIFTFAYLTFSKVLVQQIEEKKDETNEVISEINSEMSKIDTDTKKINSK